MMIRSFRPERRSIGFPDFVRYAVQQIKLFCPTLGKAKIADKLARAGIHIGKTTVERILKENSMTPPDTNNRRRKAVQNRVKVPWPHLARRFDVGTHFRRILDKLDSQRDWAALARMLVDVERDRSFFSTFDGLCRVQVPPYLRGSDRGLGSHHVR